ncbi:MAG TPA: acyl-CoA dehydrogenase family protein [Luteimonas sp.]
MTHLDTLEPIVESIILPRATELDREARFPREAVTSLGDAGLLGLISAGEVGGMGLGLAEATAVVERIARDCPATAMVVTMHYAGTTLVEMHGPEDLRRAIAAGHHLTTLAWSESGSRSHFWAPVGTATADGDAHVRLDASKSMVTSAGEADSYVWSSRPLAAEGASTIWLVETTGEGLSSPRPFDGLGLRANASAPVMAKGVRVPLSHRLGADGEGQALMFRDELPTFACLIASVSIGLMEGALARAVAHVTGTGFAAGGRLADLPTLRAQLAQARNALDGARGVRALALRSIADGGDDMFMRVLQSKAVAAEAALSVTDTAMRVCGGAAFRKDVGIERLFRDARAAAVMAPTTDVINDLVARIMCGMPLMD